MAIGKCLKCDVVAQMTEDHILPKWFRKMLPNFGIKSLPLTEIQLLCAKCNGDKGGKFDFSNKITRDVLKVIILSWYGEIKKYEDFNLN